MQKATLNQEAQVSELLFNVKLTDLTTVDNPFVVYENRKIDEYGYLLFSDELLKD